MHEIPRDWLEQMDSPEYRGAQSVLHSHISHLVQTHHEQVLKLPPHIKELLLHGHPRNVVPKLGKKEIDEEYGMLDVCLEGYVRAPDGVRSSVTPPAKYESYVANRTRMKAILRGMTMYERSVILQCTYGRRQSQIEQLIRNTENGHTDFNLGRLRWRLGELQTVYGRMARKILYE